MASKMGDREVRTIASCPERPMCHKGKSILLVWLVGISEENLHQTERPRAVNIDQKTYCHVSIRHP